MVIIMRNRNNKKASLIACADLHFRSDTPQARIDDFQQAMWGKWEQICELSSENDKCPILVAGDIGHKSEWSDDLLRKFILSTNDTGQVVVSIGQHDLKNHSLPLWKESGIGVLDAAEAITLLLEDSYLLKEQNIVIYPFPWRVPISPPGDTKRFQIAMTHQMVIEGNKEEWPGQSSTGAKKLLIDFPQYSIILSGDNHKPFVVEYKGRYLLQMKQIF